jgi:hypothetical protein
MTGRRLILIAILVSAFGPLLSGAPKARYDYYLTGNAADATGQTTLGIGLMGGGTDVDALFTWMSDRAGGGDFVVIRASNGTSYTLDVVNGVVTSTGAAFATLQRASRGRRTPWSSSIRPRRACRR